MVGFIVLFLQKKKTANLGIGLLSVGLGVLLTLWMTNVSQGEYFPRWYTSDVLTNEPQNLMTADGKISYHLKLVNPFASTHEEFLVLEFGGKRKTIRLPLFPIGRAAAGFVEANTASDWCTLAGTATANIYVLHVSARLRKSRFEINIQNGHSREIKAE